MRVPGLLLVVTVAFIFGCEKPDDIAQIRAIVLQIGESAERHDINGMLEHATNDFTANPGNSDEQRVRGVLLISLRRYGKFQVKHPEPGIRLGKDKNTADVSLPFLIVREGQQMPDLSSVADDPAAWLDQVGDAVGDPYTLELDFTKTGDGWKIRSAEISGTKHYGEL